MPLSALEAKRLKNIEDNKAVLARVMADLKATLPPALFTPKKAQPKPTVPRIQKRKLFDPYLSPRRNPTRLARTSSSLSEDAMMRPRRGSTSSSVSSATSSPSEKLIVKFAFFKKPEVVPDLEWDSDDAEEDDLDCLPQQKRQSRQTREIKSAEEITELDLARVADNVSDKHYDSHKGTTCHQCRQKTDDMKTICRFEGCQGVRGQFCGPCLRNRYGEDAREALQDPSWICPPCRNMCNCSFCRKKLGKGCTGILIHLAREKGFSNVNDYLQSLRK